MLPQITDDGDGTGNITVEGGIANSQLSLVGVAAKGTAECSCGSGDESCATVARLNIFLY